MNLFWEMELLDHSTASVMAPSWKRRNCEREPHNCRNSAAFKQHQQRGFTDTATRTVRHIHRRHLCICGLAYLRVILLAVPLSRNRESMFKVQQLNRMLRGRLVLVLRRCTVHWPLQNHLTDYNNIYRPFREFSDKCNQTVVCSTIWPTKGNVIVVNLPQGLEEWVYQKVDPFSSPRCKRDRTKGSCSRGIVPAVVMSSLRSKSFLQEVCNFTRLTILRKRAENESLRIHEYKNKRAAGSVLTDLT